ncbi:hypothetical protein [Streptomyces sp. NBC_00310]|uniref:hypothetical protein n=1 Tax=Streptomyces sp. NBC_00310 TaxID=2903645 RepID=UPI002E23D114
MVRTGSTHITNNPGGSCTAQPLIDLDVELLAKAALALGTENAEETVNTARREAVVRTKQALAAAQLAAADNARGAALP